MQGKGPMGVVLLIGKHQRALSSSFISLSCGGGISRMAFTNTVFLPQKKKKVNEEYNES